MPLSVRLTCTLLTCNNCCKRLPSPCYPCDELLPLKSQVETKDMLTDSADAIVLVGHKTLELSALRSEHLKPSLRPEFHAICGNNATTTSNLLFGDDLAKPSLVHPNSLTTIKTTGNTAHGL